MDLTIIIGLVVGLGLIAYGISDGGKLSNFISYSSMAITFGGTIAATFMSFPMSTFKYIPKHMKIILAKKEYQPQVYIDKVIEYAIEAKRKGLLALEGKANVEKDEFMKRSVLLIVDAIEPTEARTILESELDCLEERHTKGWQIYERAATFAPAFGMIGTLIGLINMLKSLTDTGAADAASTLGLGMSVALITTLYGALLANLVLVPIASRLQCRHYEEMICKEVVLEGILSIHAGVNPRITEERLNVFVNNRERRSEDEPVRDRNRGRRRSRR
ncbi:MAG TPA: motility protein A [Clostridiales bacterium]|nr:motility protein A [Clostridiales bacterium]